MNTRSVRAVSGGRRASGMTLVEVMVSVALGSLLVAMAGSLWLFGSRSFVAMSNYADLDAKSRNALDLISRDIRQATEVTAAQTSPTKQLTVLNALQGVRITYTWHEASRTLVCRKTDPSGQVSEQVYLTECDSWDFDLSQRTPKPNEVYKFYPVTGPFGTPELSICKQINMTWKCSRNILGSKMNTECVQTAQVVLRNKR